MPKTFLQSAASFAKNVGRHAHLIVQREESPGEAWAELTRDVRKLKRKLEQTTLTGDQKESLELTSRGREAYNVKDYKRAEDFFRQALVSDKDNCTAQTYLGHTMYKVGRFVEAKLAWERALTIAPSLDAGEKARRKLLMLEQKKRQTMKDIEDRFGKEGK